MRTLYIDRKNARIDMDRNRLTVHIEGQRANFSVPTHVLEMLVICADVEFSSLLLTRLTRDGVTVAFINPRQIDTCTLTHGMMHNNAERRLLQYKIINCEKQQLFFAKRLVRDKLRGQRAMLSKALKKRPDCRMVLLKVIERFDAHIDRVMDVKSIDSLRGIEGAAGASFFEAYRSLFAPTLGFVGRNRRPPRDPVNVILSLTYTMLHAEAVRALFAIGLDPLMGIYHLPDYGRESLACDLVELFRPLAERWIWRMFAEEIVRPEHFSSSTSPGEPPCLLGKRGRELYYQEYEKISNGWRRLMRRTLKHWLSIIEIDVRDNFHG